MATVINGAQGENSYADENARQIAENDYQNQGVVIDRCVGRGRGGGGGGWQRDLRGGGGGGDGEPEKISHRRSMERFFSLSFFGGGVILFVL